MGVNLTLCVGRVRVGCTGLVIGEVENQFDLNKLFSDIYEDFFEFTGKLNRVDALSVVMHGELIKGSGYGDGFESCTITQFVDFIENHAKELKTPPKEIMGLNHEWREGKREDATWEYPIFKGLMAFLKALEGSKMVFFYWS